jgi:ribulose-phosphate 3-epimerase
MSLAINMKTVCPTVTAFEPHEYREQLERVANFAKRIHLDFMDGEFTPTKSPDLAAAWWPGDVTVDIHLMFKYPMQNIDSLIELKPSLVIVHAEAEGNYVELAQQLHARGIRSGISLLAETPISIIEPAIEHIDHILIFSGDLGRFGGKVDLQLLDKVIVAKQLKNDVEIGWDGGINDQNIKILADGGVDVFNTGGYIHKSSEPQAAYGKLVKIVGAS